MVAESSKETKNLRILQVEEDVLGVNNEKAAQNRHFFAKHAILALNMVSSPGAGKTTLLAATLARHAFPAAVIEGDQTTSLDAERIGATGVPVAQLNIGSCCHLDAQMVARGMDALSLEKGQIDRGVVFIENVGNLICPAAFDLGEAAKIVLLSVTEGEEKPLKYPDMFKAASLALITKTDLLPHVPFDLDKACAYARDVNPEIGILSLSTMTGAGLDAWFDWIETKRRSL